MFDDPELLVGGLTAGQTIGDDVVVACLHLRVAQQGTPVPPG